jgi:hypothetical protein
MVVSGTILGKFQPREFLGIRKTNIRPEKYIHSFIPGTPSHPTPFPQHYTNKIMKQNCINLIQYFIVEK